MDKKMLEEIINQSVNEIFIVDRETLDILFVNRTAEELLKKDLVHIIDENAILLYAERKRYVNTVIFGTVNVN